MKTNRTYPTDDSGQMGTTQKPKRMPKLLGVAAVALFALAACTGPAQPSADTSATSPPGDTAVSQSSGQVDQLPLDFQLAVYQGGDLLGGQDVVFSDVVGQGKPVVLNFWAGLCPPCRVEMPDLQAIHEEFGDEILLVGVDVGTFTGLGNEQDGRALLQEVGVTYPAGTTANADVMRAYQVIGMPTTVFLTPNGEIHQKWTGLLTQKKMEELVQDLLAASAGS
jgi:thiol-disulfide isomerase/thioredoxin